MESNVEEKISLALLAFIALKEIAFLLRRNLQKSGESLGDLEVRVAVLSEKVEQLGRQQAVMERDQKAIWREVDKLKK